MSMTNWKSSMAALSKSLMTDAEAQSLADYHVEEYIRYGQHDEAKQLLLTADPAASLKRAKDAAIAFEQLDFLKWMVKDSGKAIIFDDRDVKNSFWTSDVLDWILSSSAKLQSIAAFKFNLQINQPNILSQAKLTEYKTGKLSFILVKTWNNRFHSSQM